MPGAWTQNFCHVVFSTKGRTNRITPLLEERLYPFLGGIVHDLRCDSLAINGMPDHAHLLVRFRPDLSIFELVRHIKARSSKWIHESFPEQIGFSWQEGYGAFTVSKSAVETVREYILNQKKHHEQRDFRSELLALLRAHGIRFDEADVLP